MVFIVVAASTTLDTAISFVRTIGSRFSVKTTRTSLSRQTVVVGSTVPSPLMWLTICLLSMSTIVVLARIILSISVQVLTCRQCRRQTNRHGRKIRAEIFRVVSVASV